jgi:hypothetical protein
MALSVTVTVSRRATAGGHGGSPARHGRSQVDWPTGCVTGIPGRDRWNQWTPGPGAIRVRPAGGPSEGRMTRMPVTRIVRPPACLPQCRVRGLRPPPGCELASEDLLKYPRFATVTDAHSERRAQASSTLPSAQTGDVPLACKHPRGRAPPGPPGHRHHWHAVILGPCPRPARRHPSRGYYRI